MKRRDYLKLTGATGMGVLAGCSSLPFYPDNFQAVVQQNNIGTHPNKIKLVTRAPIESITNEHPARIRVVMANETSKTVKYKTGHRKIFSDIYSDNENPLALIGTKDENLQAKKNCWRLKSEWEHPDEETTVTLKPGEVDEITLFVWNAHQNDGCVAYGQHIFNQTYEPANEWAREIGKFDWEFELVVTKTKE